MDPFIINQQIEELGYVDITDLSDDDITDLIQSMIEDSEA
jgi:hypothetical protein